MKKISTLLATAGLASLAMAQPTINQASFPAFGTTITSREVDGTGINPGPAGANQTWNFTAFPDTGDPVTLTYVNPSTTPFAAQFPTANYAFQGQVQESPGSTTYGYYKLDNSSFELLGSATSASGYDLVINFSNPLTQITFPASLGSSNSDTYESVANSSFPGNIFTSNGTYSYTIDAYGTLTSSSGTYNNVVRLKSRDISNDTSIISFLGNVDTTYTSYRTTNYEYMRVLPGATIAVWSISNDTSSTGLQTGSQLTVNHITQVSLTGVNEIQNPSVLATFPNPANDRVLFLLPQDARISLLDLSGRVVNMQEFSIQGGAMPVMEVSNLPAGTYLVKAEGKEYSATGKVIIVH
jgi:hypothetical protein